MPAESVTAVETVTVYIVFSICPLVINTAWLPEQVERVQPGLIDVMFVVLIVVQSIFSFQLMVTLLSRTISVAPFIGMVELTVGAVLSIVTVFPAEGVSALLDESVALLWIV